MILLLAYTNLVLITAVYGANDFMTSGSEAFPSFFAADELTAFYWTNIEGYIYTILATKDGGDSSGTYVQLLPYQCVGGGGGPASYACGTFDNNGSALFGLGETDGLQLGDGWQFSLQTSPLESWNQDNAPDITTKMSPTFTLLSSRPEPSTTSTTTSSTTSTTSSTTTPKASPTTPSSAEILPSSIFSTSLPEKSSTVESSALSSSAESTPSASTTSSLVSAAISIHTSSRTSSIATSGTGTSPPPSEGDTAGSGGSKLSPGAKAGIAIGVILFVLTMLAIMFWLWRRRRASPNTNSPHDDEDDNHNVPDATFEKPELETSGNKHEMMASPVPEHMAYHAPEEAAYSQPWHERFELSSSPAQMYVPQVPRGASPTNQYNVYHQQYQQQQRGSPFHEMSATPVPDTSSPPAPPPELSASAVYQPRMARPGGIGPPVYQPGSAQEDEIRRLEEKEREIDMAIAENERLQRLREDKERVKRRLQEVRYSGHWSGPGNG